MVLFSTIIHLPRCSSGLDFEGEDRHWFVDVLADRIRQKGIQRYVKIKHELQGMVREDIHAFIHERYTLLKKALFLRIC